MKKQFVVVSTLLLALFFTACEQETLISPIEDHTVLLENDVQPPQEAVDALEILISSDFAEDEMEVRCNTQSDAYGSLAYTQLSFGAGHCGTYIRRNYGKTSGNYAWFYYHVDQKDTPGSNYLRIDSELVRSNNLVGDTFVLPGVLQPDGDMYCAFRAYIYVWDGPCNLWRRLAVKYSTHEG